MAEFDRYGDKRPVWRDLDMAKATCAIVSTDNFGSDDPDERLVCLCWCLPSHANKMAQSMSSETSPRFFKVVELDYVLLPGFRP